MDTLLNDPDPTIDPQALFEHEDALSFPDNFNQASDPAQPASAGLENTRVCPQGSSQVLS